jgi:hypothetical protein
VILEHLVGGGFGWLYGGADDAIVHGGEDVSESAPLVEGWVQGASIDGLFDPTGHLVARPVQVRRILWAEVVSSGARVLAHGGCIFVR